MMPTRGIRRAERAVWGLVACGALLMVIALISQWSGRQDLAERTRASCMRLTLEQIYTATKDAADALRDGVLANAPGEPAKTAHALSAVNAETAARGLLKLSGVPADYPLVALAHLDVMDPSVLLERRVFCTQLFPDAPLVSL